MSNTGKKQNINKQPAQKADKGQRPSSRKRLTSREVASQALAALRGGQRTAREAIDEVAADRQLSATDLDLVTELVIGVTRHRLTLVRLLGVFSPRGWKKIDRRVQNILMVGAYQLIWLEGVPDFAVVNEAVNQARRQCGTGASKFVNAILRQLLRDIEHPRLSREQADLCRAIPVEGDQYCQLKRAILPDPKEEPVQYLAHATSHPAWLVSRWYSTFGWQQAEQICHAGTYRPVVFLRPNRLRTDSPKLAGRLQDEGYTLKVTDQEEALAVVEGPPVSRSTAFAEGFFQPQDPTAMIPVRKMDPQPGQIVIDLCAGLGTKASQMAESMRNLGTVLVCDKDAYKLEACRRNCERLGIKIVRPVELSELGPAVETLERIDWILVDVPCSNTGVLSRRPEARYRVNQQSLEQLAETQFELLATAEQMAGPDTRICYSTCSVEPEENEEITTRFARSYPYWQLADSGRTFPKGSDDPARRRDGGYWAIWVRK